MPRTVIRWTKEEEELLIDLWSKGFSAADIAKQLNRVKYSVGGKIRKLQDSGKLELRRAPKIENPKKYKRKPSKPFPYFTE